MRSAINSLLLFDPRADSRATMRPLRLAAPLFMPPALLESQLASLEPLGADESGLVVPLGRASGEDREDILTRLDLARP